MHASQHVFQDIAALRQHGAIMLCSPFGNCLCSVLEQGVSCTVHHLKREHSMLMPMHSKVKLGAQSIGALGIKTQQGLQSTAMLACLW